MVFELLQALAMISKVAWVTRDWLPNHPKEKNELIHNIVKDKCNGSPLLKKIIEVLKE